MSAFHVEAVIAYEHAVAPSHEAARWDRIAARYDLLMRVRPSPVVALSRAIAIGEIEGPERARALARSRGRSSRGASPRSRSGAS